MCVRCSGNVPEIQGEPAGSDQTGIKKSGTSGRWYCTLTKLLCPWMKEEKGIRHRGGGPTYAAQSSLRNEGSSEYILLCEGRESLSPNFQTFQDPRHQFHKIDWLVSETLYLLAILTLLYMQAELILWKFLHFLKVLKFGLWRTMSVCYLTLSLTPSGLNLCQIVKTVHKTIDTLIFIPNIDSSTAHQ